MDPIEAAARKLAEISGDVDSHGAIGWERYVDQAEAAVSALIAALSPSAPERLDGKKEHNDGE